MCDRPPPVYCHERPFLTEYDLQIDTDPMTTPTKSWKPGDIIRTRAHSGGFRVWRVNGVFLGATSQESVIELETLDRERNTEGRMCVPVELLDAAIGAFSE